jgi:tRNA A-37 threonylcarbamoyl transferase component Bud32
MLWLGHTHLPGRPISPDVLFLEYLKDAHSLRDVETKLITQPIVRALKETVTAFGRLGVAHCDLNYGNVVFLVGYGGISRAVIIDFGSSCVRDDELDEEWDAIVEVQSDMAYLEKRLAGAFKERP